jgi:putative PIN family toxin of toxin-antitoxin system
VLSSSALDEAGRVLRYPRLAKRYALAGAEIAGFIAFLSASANLVVPDETVAPPIRDPDDVHVIQMAVAGEADYLCTLDAHFYDPAVHLANDDPAEQDRLDDEFRDLILTRRSRAA